MHRLTLIITMIALLVVPATALASPEQIYNDCEDNGRLDRRYTDADLRKAARQIPPDLDEYSNCRELIRGALSGVDTTGGAGGGSTSGTGSLPEGLPQGNGVGSVPLDPQGKPLNPLVDAQDDERADVAAASAGRDIVPTSAGVRPGDADGELPASLLVVLILGGLALLSAAGLALKQRVVGRFA